MSASLVGSEMCIRDRCQASWRDLRGETKTVACESGAGSGSTAATGRRGKKHGLRELRGIRRRGAVG
eukprot:8710897-Alexandrium_andersonii.AAC.1